MISLIFKFTIAFSLSYLILSFNIGNKPIFYHLNGFTGPVGENIQNSLGKSVTTSLKKSKELGKQLFESSSPRVIDSIKSKQSSIKKSRYSNSHLTQEDIDYEEKVNLDKLIEKN